MGGSPVQKPDQARKNATVAIACGVFVAGMVGMSYAAVPLYEMFCRVTGYNGTTQRVDQVSDVVLDRTIKVTFDANTAPGLGWDFKPVVKSIDPRIGETVKVDFKAENTWDRPTKGQAVFNVTPMEAAAYFNKIECFCFTETELKPGEILEMPVVFYVDPDIATAPETKDIRTITLSYTFYPHNGDKPVAALPQKDEDKNRKM